MDLKGTLGVRVRRALLRVPCVFRVGATYAAIGDAGKIGEIRRRSRKSPRPPLGDDRENHRLRPSPRVNSRRARFIFM